MTRRERPRLGVSGITLIETLVALSLFAISAASISTFIVQQIRSSNTNSNYSIAYELGVQELEDMRAQLFDQMAPRTKQQMVGGMKFKVKTAVTDGVPSVNMKTIDVNVDWNEPGGPRNVKLHTIYTAVTR